MCHTCRQKLPLDRFHGDTNIKAWCRSSCKKCVSKQNYKYRQASLKKRFERGEENIKLCRCGNFFNKKPTGFKSSERTKCRTCSYRPTIKVYVAELNKSVWVKAPIKELERCLSKRMSTHNLNT